MTQTFALFSFSVGVALQTLLMYRTVPREYYAKHKGQLYAYVAILAILSIIFFLDQRNTVTSDFFMLFVIYTTMLAYFAKEHLLAVISEKVVISLNVITIYILFAATLKFPNSFLEPIIVSILMFAGLILLSFMFKLVFKDKLFTMQFLLFWIIVSLYVIAALFLGQFDPLASMRIFVVAPSLLSLYLLFSPHEPPGFLKATIYAWFLLMNVFLALVLYDFGGLKLFIQGGSIADASFALMFITGMNLTFLLTNFWHVFDLIPLRGKRQTWQEAMREWRSNINSLIRKYDSTQIASWHTYAIVVLQIAFFAFNASLGLLPPLVVIQLWLVLMTFEKKKDAL